MKMVTINIRLEKEVKESADALFKELGINTSAAINMFLIKCIKENGIPFKVTTNKDDSLSSDTIRKIKNYETKELDNLKKLYNNVCEKYDEEVNEDYKI